MDIRKNPWLKDANRKSLVTVKITSLNLHGTGRRKGFVRPTEIFTTMFKMEVRLGRRVAGPGAGHMWMQARTFDEFREFYDRLTTTGGANSKEKLTVHALCLFAPVLDMLWFLTTLLDALLGSLSGRKGRRGRCVHPPGTQGRDGGTDTGTVHGSPRPARRPLTAHMCRMWWPTSICYSTARFMSSWVPRRA